MNITCLFLTFLRLITAANGLWGLDSVISAFERVLFHPCLDRKKMSERLPGVQNKLRDNLIGQPFVYEHLVSMLKNHLTGEPHKPLVISMHGWTGTGKNYATELIVKAIYENGFNNPNVHLFSGRLHFPLSTNEAVNEYKVNLHNWIHGNVSRCGFSTFIFDEIDKVPVEVIDAIKPFLDYHSLLDGVDYRNAIFIFITNNGGNVITKKYIELWESGISRNNMDYKSFEPVLRRTLYNTQGSFEKSSILEDHLVSLYLPFLPLEKEHIRRCIEREMMVQKVEIAEESVELVFAAMEFFRGRFSVSGCKRVSDQVALLRFRSRDEL